MNKSDLIRSAAQETGLTESAVERVVAKLLGDIQAAAANGEEVSLHGFGKFAPTTRAARTGRNPQTGEEIQIPASKTVTFKASKQLKDALNVAG